MNESNYLIFENLFVRKILSILQKEVRWVLRKRVREFFGPKDLCPELDIPHNWGSWFYFKDHTIIKVFGSPVTREKLPIIFHDRVSLLEIMHQLVEVDKSLVGGSHKKRSMIPSQVVIGMYHFLNRKKYEILDSILNKYRLTYV